MDTLNISGLTDKLQELKSKDYDFYDYMCELEKLRTMSMYTLEYLAKDHESNRDDFAKRLLDALAEALNAAPQSTEEEQMKVNEHLREVDVQRVCGV